MPTTDQYLDLDGIGQRQATFQWELLDDTLVHLDYIDVAGPPQTPAPVISNDPSQLVARTLSGFVLPPDAGAEFEELHARIRPWLVMPDGAAEALGTFLFVDARRIRNTYGIDFEGTLGDLSVLVNQQSIESVGFPAGTLIETQIARLLEQQGIFYYLIDTTGITVGAGAPVAWPAGSSVKSIIDELASLMGCLPLYFEADGRARVRITPDPAVDPVDVTYLSGLNIFDDGIADSNTLLSAPNYFKVIESGNAGSQIVGVWQVPDSAPNSFHNLGRYIPSITNEQGMLSNTAANEVARLRGLTKGTIVSNLGFDGPPDWRHGTYSVVSVLGVRYLERSWTLTCEEGAAMTHQASRVYS